MNLLERRRAMMSYKVEPKEWDYILYPWDGSELGWIATKILNVRAGQTVILEVLTDGTSSCWLYFAAPNILDPQNYRLSSGQKELHFELPVLTDGKIGVSGHYAWADGKQGTGSYFTYAYYIKIKIV